MESKKTNKFGPTLEVGDRIIYEDTVTQITAIQLVSRDPVVIYLELDNGKYIYSPENTIYEVVQMHN